MILSSEFSFSFLGILFIYFISLTEEWLTYEARIYEGKEAGSSINGAGKTGQLQKILLPTWAQSLWS